MTTDTKKLRELLAKGTQGEWKREALGGTSTILIQNGQFSQPPYGYRDGGPYALASCFVVDRTTGRERYVREDITCFKHDDAALIVAAVNALPELLDEVEAANARADKAEAELARVREAIHRHVWSEIRSNLTGEFENCFKHHLAADRYEISSSLLDECARILALRIERRLEATHPKEQDHDQ